MPESKELVKVEREHDSVLESPYLGDVWRRQTSGTARLFHGYPVALPEVGELPRAETWLESVFLTGSEGNRDREQ